MASTHPSDHRVRYLHAVGKSELGRRLAAVGHFDQARECFSEAINSELAQFAVVDHVLSQERLSHLLSRMGKFRDATASIQTALEIAERELAPRAIPSESGWGRRLIYLNRCRASAALQYLYAGDFESAEQHLRSAIDSIEPWANDLPAYVWFQYYLGRWYHDLAESLTGQQNMAEAEEARRQSLAAWESASHSDFVVFLHGRGIAHYRLGELLHRTGRMQQAAEHFEMARATYEELAARQPDSWDCHWPLICMLANCPAEEFRDPARAVELAVRALPKHVGHCWRYTALAQYRNNEFEAAADSVKQGMRLREGGDAIDQTLLAIALHRTGRVSEANDASTNAKTHLAEKRPVFYEYLGIDAVNRLIEEADVQSTGRAILYDLAD
ncbi:MAG: tetratricopeptide repeat protein [Planctomycetales bacterium]|nr:tetratricopeptide repeat protein [Planctomycetales bacterium]